MDKGIFLIDDNDILKVAKEFFNTFSGNGFYDAIKYLCKGVGYGNEYSACEFSDDLGSGEEIFEGVRFRYLDDDLVVSFKDFRLLISEAVEGFLINHPDQKERIENLINRNSNFDFMTR